jgi:uncharacterized protein (TIGR00369 family)
MDGGDDKAVHLGPSRIEHGEFAGWCGWGDDAFETLTGPFFFKVDPDGSVRCAFRAEKRHMNGGGAMHGGCMMTFADFCLFALSHPHREARGDAAPMVTISLNGEFVGPAFEGDLIEGRGEVVRAGGSLMFLRGVIATGGRPMMTFSGVIKRVRSRTQDR